ncbi:MAG: hypothetical protein WAN11_03905 [Syntrophobacteraceae bacterium]
MEFLRNSRVTVVDDDELACESRAEIIRGWGLSAEGFTQPQFAIESVRANRCDVILLNVFICDTCRLALYFFRSQARN